MGVIVDKLSSLAKVSLRLRLVATIACACLVWSVVLVIAMFALTPGTVEFADLKLDTAEVRLRNPGASTVVGPFLIQLSLQPEGGEWHPLGTQMLDKVPAGYLITRDFVPHDVGELVKKPFTVRVQVNVDESKLLEREVKHAGTEEPEVKRAGTEQ